MNPYREVLVGGAVVVDDERHRGRRQHRSTLLARPSGGRRASTPAGCVVTPGMINAHQHLTGDPLVRSCIPDLLPPGASIFEWSVPLHGAHTRTTTSCRRSLCARRVAAERRHDRRRGRHGRPPRAGGRRASRRSACAARSARGAGTSRTVRSPRRPTRCSTGNGPSSSAARRAGWSRGGSRSSATTSPRTRCWPGAADLARELGTGMTMHLSPTSSDPERYLARTGRRPVVHLDAPRRARTAPAAGPRRVARRRGDRPRAGAAARRSPTARGPTCASVRGSPASGATPRSSSVAGGSPSAATRRTPATSPTSCGRRRPPPASPATRGSTPSASARTTRLRAGHDRRCRGHRHGRPDRLARARQAGRPRRPPRRRAGAGRRAATSGCSWCGAPTDGRCVTSSIAGRPVLRDGRASPSTPKPSWRAAGEAQHDLLAPRRDHGPSPLALRRRALTQEVGLKWLT